MLDTLLIVRGEECRSFSLAIGIDVKHPWQQAAWLQMPPVALPTERAPQEGRESGWLFHVNNKHVSATSWEPIRVQGKLTGVRTRLLETAGALGRTALRVPYNLRGAQQVDFLGRIETDRPVEGDTCRVDLAGHDWIEVEAWWADRSTTSPYVVTIDGPAGAGKSSVAREVARALGIAFLDTGAMYRAVALAAIERSVEPDDARALADLVEQIDVRINGDRVYLDGRDVSDAIRSNDVTDTVSRIADHLAVRNKLVQWQRAFAQGRSLVTEGRDQGTVVFPDATLKVYLTASPEERARRRLEQLRADGIDAQYDSVLEAQRQRDERDARRPVGALRRAEDAVEIDTDGKSKAEVVDEIVTLVRAAVGEESADST